MKGLKEERIMEETPLIDRRVFMKMLTFALLSPVLRTPEAVAEQIKHPFEAIHGQKIKATPTRGQSTYDFLRMAGLDPTKSLDLFSELNYQELSKTPGLRLDKKYRLPIQAIQVSKTYLQTLKKRGLHPKYTQEIHKFNQDYNPDYAIKSIDKVPPNQIIWIPEWNSGFYTRMEVTETEEDPPHKTSAYLEIKRKAKENLHSLNLGGKVIIVDPGHGGNDPGALNPNKDKTIETLEAPYVYDIALRVMKLATQHGAEVYLTHYSPLHTISNKKNLGRIKDSVYNMKPSGAANIHLDSSGTSIKTRKLITEALLKNAKKEGYDTSDSSFISIHADSIGSEYEAPPRVLTDRRDKDTQFAKIFAKNTGSRYNAHERSQGLGL